MPHQNLYYRLRIRNPKDTVASPTGDAVVITSVRSGTNPYIVEPPTGDGASFNPLTGESMLGSYTVKVADWPIGGSPLQRVLTSQLEDTNFQQQLGYRRAVVELSPDGTTWSVLVYGVLTLLRLIDAMTYEVTVQDPMRWMQNALVFSPASSMKMTDWFTQWPLRGCIVGGPVSTPVGSGGIGPLGMTDFGGWQMKVESFDGKQYVLRPHVVYGPGNWQANTKTNLGGFADTINAAAQKYAQSPNDNTTDSWVTINDAFAHSYYWTNLTWLVLVGGVWTPFKPLPFAMATWIVDGTISYQIPFVSNLQTNGNWGIGLAADSVTPGPSLTVGAYVQVRGLNVLPTDDSPLYLQGHPCQILKQIWDATSIPYDATALTTMQNQIGGGANMVFRFAEPKSVPDIVNQIVEPFGIGLRGDANGQIQVFDGRIAGSKNTALPSVTITAADVIDGTTRLPYELDPSQAAYVIKFQQNRLTPQHTVPYGQNGIVDGVMVGSDQLTLFNATDPNALPFGSLDWTTEGFITFINAFQSWAQWVTTQARTIFTRFGRGGLALETTLLRGGAGDALNLGDEALINLPQLPNHNYRLGDNATIAARRMQIVQRTVLPEGYAVRFQDSGVGLQPLALVPTLTIALSASQGRNVAVVTITNAATINTNGYSVRVQMAVRTDAATPADAEYTDVIAWGAGTVPTAAFQLPPVTAGATVWARARCETGTGASMIPSSWSVPVSVLLSPINPPTGLTVTAVTTDGSLATLKWTPGAGTASDLVDIWLRAGGTAFALATRIAVLSAGSTQYLLEGLTPGSAYIASVQYRDPMTGMASAAVDLAFTAGATQRTLSAPVNPVAFAGIPDPKTGVPSRDGSFGIAVIAAEYPASLEVQIAVETAVGSGTYGAFTTQAVAPAIGSVLGNWTKGTFVAPNDGLHRQLQARHVLDGCTPSAYTAPVTVLPWTPLALPPMPTSLFIEITVLPPSPSTDDGVNLRFQVNCIDPFGQPTQVAVTNLFGTGVAIVSGPALGVYSPNDTIWKVSLPTSGGPGSMNVRGQTADGRSTGSTMVLPANSVGVIAQPSATISFDPISGNTSKQASVGFTVSVATGQSIRYLGSKTAQPTQAATIASGTIDTGPFDGNNFSQTNIDTVTLGDTYYLTIVPFTGPSASGTALPEVQLKSTFSVWGNQKTAFFNRAQWQVGDSHGHTVNDSGDILNAVLGTTTIRSPSFIHTVIPIGALLVSAQCNYWWNTSGVAIPLGGVQFGVDANNTNMIAAASGTSGTDTSTRTIGPVGLANTLTTTSFVALHFIWQPQVSTGATAAQSGIQDCQITYIAPTQAVTP